MKKMVNKDDIFKELLELAKRAYVPYSNFRVSCIIKLKNNEKVYGINIENAAYSPSLCGERSALASLISQGYNKDDVESFYLYTDSKGIGTMCGVCRQFMIEVLDPKQLITIFNKSGPCLEARLEEFLPYYFDKGKL
ncbi:cytidine deaminase [Spiroplasma endosymbiont of Aspidapion aeneum]|uniref:cytidine deaminase n=1 Tax=Spiroplasma endosymbiont of Aspidapion aeneum TaxID=3066276 RepID=UPI00313ADDBB